VKVLLLRSTTFFASLRARAPFCALVLLTSILLTCAEREEDSPERAVQEFIDRMQRVHGDIEKSKAAFDLLARDAQSNLEERAKRASAAVGQVVRPEEMLAPSRFYLSFIPRSWSTREGPGWAIVTAYGESPRERKEIRCLREEDRWKVLLELPDLPPIEQRRDER
jgi:hypothetical protein